MRSTNIRRSTAGGARGVRSATHGDREACSPIPTRRARSRRAPGRARRRVHRSSLPVVLSRERGNDRGSRHPAHFAQAAVRVVAETRRAAGGRRRNSAATAKFWNDVARGRFYKPIKTSTTVRIDADVLAWLRAQGKGYQSRINAILRREMLAATRGRRRRRVSRGRSAGGARSRASINGVAMGAARAAASARLCALGASHKR